MGGIVGKPGERALQVLLEMSRLKTSVHLRMINLNHKAVREPWASLSWQEAKVGNSSHKRRSEEEWCGDGRVEERGERRLHCETQTSKLQRPRSGFF